MESVGDESELKQAVAACFAYMRSANPTWTLGDLSKMLNLAQSSATATIARSAGFTDEEYGSAAYGSSHYGTRYREVSLQGSTVMRRVTAVGQVFYRGKRYTLGKTYRNKLVGIKEEDKELVVTPSRGPSFRLTMRMF